MINSMNKYWLLVLCLISVPVSATPYEVRCGGGYWIYEHVQRNEHTKDAFYQGKKFIAGTDCTWIEEKE